MTDHAQMTEMDPPEGRRVEPPRRRSNSADVRAEIEMTRARMSETIDEIESALLRKKARLQNRMDVTGRVRERAVQSAGAALAAGFLLGYLTGGDGGVGRVEDEYEARLADAERRARHWESRARRLVRHSRRQAEALRMHEALAEVHSGETGHGGHGNGRRFDPRHTPRHDLRARAERIPNRIAAVLTDTFGEVFSRS